MGSVEKSQGEKFKNLAKEVNADESEEAFDETLKRITKPEKGEKSPPPDKNKGGAKG